ncbi:C40 family peptidase [Aerococcus kribbianus]|uniref:LysM peptidoglycan-binding domain-containing protein n=1 Tax=Aerococcus kribbianus TaxID=2999064 RepID=A0A9X3JEQ1_9LACT|nr:MULTISPECIES: C40 family peptidase [unclassified Aerococcus]MCZ0717394.1 LysM peptidoglycan-binding domain-containing protein [Aerococcus sp. YH-aer221]MCZ0725682.1 LysM peptidoglycan-binding domain-containing protein [Aerococcus sp. YH-aer222]
MSKSIKTMVGASFATTAALVAFAPQVSAEEVYTIQDGDTLSALSKEFNTTINEIAELNGIENPNLIITGKDLKLPGSEEVEFTSEAGIYTVKAGDTLNKIAAAFDTTAQNIRDLNGINGDLILIGQKLRIEGQDEAVVLEEASEEVVEETPVEESTEEIVAEEAPVEEEGQEAATTYVVKAGDTLSKIASEHGISVADLKAFNGISSDLILVGQELNLVGDSSAQVVLEEVVEEAPVEKSVVEETPVLEETVEEEPVVEEAQPVLRSAETVETAQLNTAAEEETEAEVVEAEEEAQAELVEAEDEAKAELEEAEAEAAAQAEAEAAAQAEAEAAAQAEAEAAAQAEAEAAAQAEAEAAAQAEAEAAAQAEAEAAAQAEAEAAAQAEAEAAAQAEAEAKAAQESQNVASSSSILGYAEQFIGTPYVWGGKTPSGFDCSGFVQYVYKNTRGVNVGGYTGAQQYAGPQISVSQAQPGDLLFWGGYGSPYHVAIYAGNGSFIHASQPGTPLGYSTISPYWQPSFAVSMAAYR